MLKKYNYENVTPLGIIMLNRNFHRHCTNQ
jgi:hypothetical protein